MVEVRGKEHQATNLQKMMIEMRTAGTQRNTARIVDEDCWHTAQYSSERGMGLHWGTQLNQQTKRNSWTLENG